jgi:beta-lactamase class A
MTAAHARIGPSHKNQWPARLRSRIAAIESHPRYEGKLGVVVRDLVTGLEVASRAEEPWYLASGVKLPIALETLKQIDEGRFSLESEVILDEEDFVDGAGETNSHPAGSSLSVRALLEQMMIHSDNTASDLLIKKVGLARVNARVRELVPDAEFSPITRLAEVRRLAYGAIHPRARLLGGKQLLLLRAIPDDEQRLQALARMLDLPRSELRFARLDDAFARYYESRVNSATLHSYALLLESLVRGKALSPARTRYLLELMARAETGRNRIRAGLKGSTRFAHKTGTQRGRVCDFGILWSEIGEPSQGKLIAACVRNLPLEDAEAILATLGAAIQG